MEKLTEERLEKFRKTMESAKSNIAIILSHIDPDAISCARIFAEICKHSEKNPSIFYAGVTDDPQNNYVYNKFDLADDFKPLAAFNELENKDEYDTVLLDSSSLKDGRLGGLEFSPVVIIDHHPNENKLEESENTWYWIEGCGAAISKVVKLFLELGLEFKISDDLATLAVIGLLTDADIKLLSPQMKEIDYDTFHCLSRYMNAAKAKETFDALFDMKYVRLFVKAFDNIARNENVILTYFEDMSREELGYLARLADELCRIKEVEIVFIWVVCEDTLYVKARSTDDKVKLDENLKKIFGEKYAGARHGKGAAAVPLGFCAPTEDSRTELMDFMKVKISEVIKL